MGSAITAAGFADPVILGLSNDCFGLPSRLSDPQRTFHLQHVECLVSWQSEAEVVQFCLPQAEGRTRQDPHSSQEILGWPGLSWAGEGVMSTCPGE